MATLALALAFLFLLHQATEGVIRFRWPDGPSIMAAIRVGNVQIVIRRYRPRRIYFRLAYAGACAGGA